MAASLSPRLTPLVAPWMLTLQQHPALLDRLIQKYHSPLNILCLDPFESNARDFASVFEEQDSRYGILFARKANKCRAFVKRAGAMGIGVDTASHRELEQALEAGVPVSRLVLTAAIKEERALRLALQNDVLIILDNEDECRLVDRLAQSLNCIARVAFRKRDSRGDELVGLEMNTSQMQSSSADFLLDPFLIPREGSNRSGPVSVYLTGAYCLEGDLLLKRSVEFAQKPEVGDFVLFVNTAGYMMHFNESEAHLFDLAENLIYAGNGDTPEDCHFVPD